MFKGVCRDLPCGPVYVSRGSITEYTWEHSHVPYWRCKGGYVRPLYLDHGVCVRWLAMGFSHAGWGVLVFQRENPELVESETPEAPEEALNPMSQLARRVSSPVSHPTLELDRGYGEAPPGGASILDSQFFPPRFRGLG